MKKTKAKTKAIAKVNAELATKKKKRPRTYVPIRNLTLRVLAGAGAVSILLLAPKLTHLLKQFDRATVHRTQLYNRLNGALSRLEQSGLVTVSGVYGKRTVALTKKGEEVAEQAELEGYCIEEPAFWDGKWRVLIFDITERRRRVRNQLRQLLQNAGFVRLQDSVWIYPYPCDEFITLVRAHLRSGVGELRSFVAEALESDRALRAYFKLL